MKDNLFQPIIITEINPSPSTILEDKHVTWPKRIRIVWKKIQQNEDEIAIERAKESTTAICVMYRLRGLPEQNIKTQFRTKTKDMAPLIW